MFLKGNTFLNFPDFLIPNTHLSVAYSMICFAEARRPEMEAALHQTLRLYDGDHRQGFGSVKISVADPYIYYTDPDPALFVIYGSGSGSGSGSRLFYDTKIIFLNFFF